MKYVDEFRDTGRAQALLRQIGATVKGTMETVNLMEVCGTHTVAISKFGIRSAIPREISLLSGPGCPVCVTSNRDIDFAVELSKKKDVTIATFGDMVRVPGSQSSLMAERAKGADVRIVYSPMDSVKLAQDEKNRKVVFLGVGFETTSPTIACSILEAERLGLENFSVICSPKLIPPAMEALVNTPELNLGGFICPGHVSTIIGSRPYEFIARDHGIPCVISGFEATDILQSIGMLVSQIKKGEAKVEIQYSRVVHPEGNPLALGKLYDVFEVADAEWRGFGSVPKSGLKPRKKYERFDARHVFPEVKTPEPVEPKGCICPLVLRGVKKPTDCKLFRRVCTPDNPVGACMVSFEGTCSTYFKYERGGK